MNHDLLGKYTAKCLTPHYLLAPLTVGDATSVSQPVAYCLIGSIG